MPLAQMILFGVFFFLVGGCIGSFLNVVIWRLPHRGREVMYLEKKGAMTLSWPPSHCPMCDQPIQWYQNIPVLSYLLLRGRCANCRVSIPIRYPLVELATSLLWGGMFLAYFVGGWQGHVYPWQQGGGVSNLATDWPPYVLHGVFASALLAASAIDADLFIIPLSITWFLMALGLAGSALIGPPLTQAYAVIPSLAGGGWLPRAVAGGTVGLILANVLLWVGILPRSFPWELEGEEEPKGMIAGSGKPENSPGDSKKRDAKSKRDEKATDEEEALAPPPTLTKFGPAVAAAIALLVIIAVLWVSVSPTAAALGSVVGAIMIFLIGVLPRDEGQTDVTDEVMEEISGPGVRFEILKEMLFMAIPLACAGLAYLLPLELPQVPWLMRVLGSLLGLMVGGSVLWIFRIGGSLWLNKQAMGIGDVHLMAGVGAVVGAPLALMVFFGAPFVAIVWALVLKIMGKPNVLPYGPWLSVASILVLLVGNPLFCWYLALMVGGKC